MPKRKPAKKRRHGTTAEERTAYHEAGHAVAAYLMHRRFKHITIVPEGDVLGRVKFSLPNSFRPDHLDTDRRNEKRIETEIIIELAGLVSEGILAGRRNWRGARGDLDSAVNLASYRYFDPELIGKYIEWLLVLTRHMIEAPRNWPMVQAVAKELLAQKRVSYSQARRVMRTVQETAFRRSIRPFAPPAAAPDSQPGPPAGRLRERRTVT